MNAERLHIIALTLRREIEGNDVVGRLQNLVSACQQISNQASNPGLQQNFASSRESFFTAVTDTSSDAFAPAWRQVLVEIGGEGLFGKILKQQVEQILAENQVTLVVAYQKLNDILTKLREFHSALTRLTDSLSYLQIGSEKLAPGEAEITLLIPRDAVDDKLAEFADELKEMEFILNAISEMATGHTDDLKIRTVSSSGLTVFLLASPVFGAAVAKAINFVVTTYQKILQIKKLSLEIEQLQMPAEFADRAKEYANSFMEEQIEKFSVEITNSYPVENDPGRRNELTTKVRMSLNKIANRIDRGFNFEVRIEPPSTPSKEPEQAKEINQAVRAIQSASPNMRYMKPEGPPILSLPERAAQPDEPKEKDGNKEGHKPRGRRAIHLDDKT